MTPEPEVVRTMEDAMKDLCEAVDWQIEINAMSSPPITAEHLRHANKLVDDASREVVKVYRAALSPKTQGEG